MSNIVGLTRGGAQWEPAFVTALDQGKCIGCGRCYNVCPRSVFNLIDREEAGLSSAGADDDDDPFGDDDSYEDDDDGFSDDTSMVMSLADALDCIGCQACSKVCPKKCLTHQPQPVAAA